MNFSYRADVDGLRALAILPVVFFYFFPTYMPGGFVGVDIFFVISGFLISNIIFNGLENKKLPLFKFLPEPGSSHISCFVPGVISKFDIRLARSAA